MTLDERFLLLPFTWSKPHDTFTIIIKSFTFHNEMENILYLHEIILSFVVVGSLLTRGKHYNPDLNNTNYHNTITIEVIRNSIISLGIFLEIFFFLKSFVYMWLAKCDDYTIDTVTETNRHSQLNFVSGHERLNLNLNFTEETESKRNGTVV